MRIFSLIVLLIAIAGLTSCASAPSGNFVEPGVPAGLTEKLVSDAVKRLEGLYPPASTRFNLGQATQDTFGQAFVESLRSKGYALQEFNSNSNLNASGVPLRYVLDAPTKNLYRITLIVGQHALNRAYAAQNNSVVPAGAWVRKE